MERRLSSRRKKFAKRIIGLPKLLEALFHLFLFSQRKKAGSPSPGRRAGRERERRPRWRHLPGPSPGHKFNRIQFTPDLKPLDLIRIVEQREDRTLEFHSGPLFSNLVLADEINRAHEKTRAALLEAMGEKQITVGRTTYPLEEPFFVMATENPIDVEGTFYARGCTARSIHDEDLHRTPF